MAPRARPDAAAAAHRAAAQVASVLLLATLGEPAGSRVCDCLNWKQVYGEGLAECGEGAELFHFLARAGVSARDARWIQRENPAWASICTEFFTKLDTDRCVNVAVHPHGRAGLPGSSWCYVSSDCRSLNGGSPLADTYSFFGLGGRAVSWKRCARGADPLLADMPPGDLLELATS
ncbi:unnamed protein product [Prorocentrum cordatum]|uniref:Uncharacterized protein n=1 Tax=Prorocentrum cordatum TaxID=2364126 RepID=A0ABN9QCH0_9DINO|nr:unnamed protein product [Polarella glacialis]